MLTYEYGGVYVSWFKLPPSTAGDGYEEQLLWFRNQIWSYHSQPTPPHIHSSPLGPWFFYFFLSFYFLLNIFMILVSFFLCVFIYFFCSTAQLRVCADGGANRLYHEMPLLFPHQNASLVQTRFTFFFFSFLKKVFGSQLVLSVSLLFVIHGFNQVSIAKEMMKFLFILPFFFTKDKK